MNKNTFTCNTISPFAFICHNNYIKKGDGGALPSPKKIAPQHPTLPSGLPESTIGSEGLNDRVRDGNGCFPFDMATRLKI